MTTKTPKLKKDGEPQLPAGRPVGSKARSDLKKRKFKTLSISLQDHVAAAILKAANLMTDDKASAQVQLTAAKYIIDKYGECLKEAYSTDGKNNPVEDDDEDEKPQAAILSFSVVDNTKK